MSWVVLELDDDPETLRAALALIDTLDDDANADTAAEQTDRSTSTSTSDSDQAEKRSEGEDEVLPTDTRKTRTKRGPRQEILTLRAKVDELENTLKRQKTNADLVLNGGSDVLTVSNVWKEVAKRQHRYRRESEMENLRLRTMLQSQITIGEQLVHFIQKNLEGQPGYDEVMIEANASHSGKPPLRMTREQQYNYLDDLYRQSNEIFAATGFQTKSTSYRDIRVTNDADGGSIIEMQAGWVVPFPMHDVTKALWEAIALRADGAICKTMRMNIEAQEDAVLTSFSVVASSFDDDFATGFAGNMVTRRFDHNSSQNVIVSTMLGEMLGKVPSLTHGLRLRV
ncbi:hypothetical protein Poli38472_004921 [Pythium oligandrum]|uniref:Uncharacterized protein n=1 Tax=Pythium oligandrum TaxID=41045 RepID=A0A8K1FHK6_PYTOL|nr:hypothetical protein Poli38472_004921 [Pythium oligandrum]|eukprot:TMW59852.1 hypothetical protein Poli38472_004921 [Pythium oligandrum]